MHPRYGVPYKNPDYRRSSSKKNFYFSEKCTKQCPDVYDGVLDRFDNIPGARPKNAGSFNPNTAFIVADTNDVEGDAETCAQSCLDVGSFLCQSFTFVSSPTSGVYGQCRHYKNAYHQGYLRTNFNKDFYAIKTCYTT